SISTSIRRLPASSAFSSNSFTTLAGRSMTSPAAIFVTTSEESWRMGIRLFTCSPFPFLHLALQRAFVHGEVAGGLLGVAARFRQRLADLVLKLPVLDDSIERPLPDAQHAGGLLAVAVGQLKRLGDVVALDLIERTADQVARASGLTGSQRRAG